MAKVTCVDFRLKHFKYLQPNKKELAWLPLFAYACLLSTVLQWDSYDHCFRFDIFATIPFEDSGSNTLMTMDHDFILFILSCFRHFWSFSCFSISCLNCHVFCNVLFIFCHFPDMTNLTKNDDASGKCKHDKKQMTMLQENAK